MFLKHLTRPPVTRVCGPLALYQRTVNFVHQSAPIAAGPATAHPSKLHGSTHWVYERLGSIALLPTMTYALAVGPHPLNDMALGILVPVHLHLGFMEIITDYIPKRNWKLMYSAATWSLRIATLALMYGCWYVNTNDKGVTHLSGQLWHARASIKASDS